MFDIGTFEGLLFYGVVQVIIWLVILQTVEVLIAKYGKGKDWFERLDKIPGGSAEWIVVARAWPNHVCFYIKILQ